ncbi:hypothetical protein BG004_004497 [Podila humilis]|nr:hypothetical protein BG004_004497 [Podila humilis]
MEDIIHPEPAMGVTQSFRLAGTTEIMRIPIQHIDGQKVIDWKSIERVFPGVKCVKNGDVAVPSYIKSFSDVVLEVVLFNDTEKFHVDSSLGAPSVIPTADLHSAIIVGQANASTDRPIDPSSTGNFVESLRVTSKVTEMPLRDIGARDVSTSLSDLTPNLLSNNETVSRTALSFIETLRHASTTTKDTDIPVNQREFNAKMGHMYKLLNGMMKLQEASDAKQRDIIRLNEEMKQMQQRALEQLSVIQSRVQAVLTQNYELHEYQIPRLFIVLPQYPSGWNILDPFTEKYRLYFLCECGEHTKAAGTKNNIPHKIHLAKHAGYEITQPTEFFKHASVASVAVPAIAHLINADALDHAAKGLQHLNDCVEPGMDQVITKIEKDSVDDGESIENFDDHMEKKEASEGADLRKLVTFLKDKDGNKVLGNLYRTVTGQGHVKWVCMDHYRENYNKTAADGFRRTVESLGGTFDENSGLVQVTLGSSVSANLLYLALEKARFVHELDIIFKWDCSKADLLALEEVLNKSAVSVLYIDLRQFRPSRSSKLSSIPARYEALYRITNPPNLKSVHIVLPKDLVKLSNFTPKRPSHLDKLSFEMVVASTIRVHAGIDEHDSTVTSLYRWDKSIVFYSGTGALSALLSESLKVKSTLTNLDLKNAMIDDNGIQALSEALKTNATLMSLELEFNLIGSNGAQALAEALKMNSTLTTLRLKKNATGPNGAQALSEALMINSTLTTLDLQSNSIGPSGAQKMFEVLRTNSALTTLNLAYNSIGPNGARMLSEALKINSTLTSLYLNDNSLGLNGAQAMAGALKMNSTLSFLDLGDNTTGADGAQVLYDALMINSTLKTLYLSPESAKSASKNEIQELFGARGTKWTVKLVREGIDETIVHKKTMEISRV